MANADIKIDCPSRETLQELINGTVSDVEDLELHLQSCQKCRHELDDLSQSDVLKPFLKDGSYYDDTTQFPFLDAPAREGDLGCLNGLHIESEIGRGGAGIVFRGFEPDLERTVAVKVLNNVGSFRSEARFERESRIAAQIQSDYVVDVHALGRTRDNRPYIVMPLIEGNSLKEALAEEAFNPRLAAERIYQIAQGLKVLHESGIIHRDVKPANILIDDSDSRAKLTDFGLARETVTGTTLTQADVLCGTPEYMSPEQSCEQDVTFSSDIYSLGITLYECLTGTTPFRGGSLDILQQHRNVSPVRPSQINPRIARDLETICLKAIAKEPSRRYQDVNQFAADLKRFLDGQPITARETPSWEKLYLWSRRNPRIAALSATTACLMLILGLGSSIAAWNLKHANHEILIEKQKAQRAEKRAVQDRTAAISALNRLVDTLYDDLSNNAATIKAREKLVEAAMSGLKSVTNSEGDDTADRTAYLGYLRMADLAALQGDFKTAFTNYEQAIALARQLCAQEPENDSRKIDLAHAISQLGVARRTSNPEASEELSLEAESIFEKLLAKSPDDQTVLAKFVIEKANRFELMRNQNMTDFNRVITYGNSILPYVEKLFQQSDLNLTACTSGYAIHFLLGRAYLESGDPTQGIRHFQSAQEFVQLGLKQAPNNFRQQSASATLDRAMSMTLLTLGQIDESLRHHESSVATFERLSAANPQDLKLRGQVANTLSLGSLTLLANGKIEVALEALNRAEEMYLSLISDAPDNNYYRIVLVENQLRRIMISISTGRWQLASDMIAATESEISRGQSKNVLGTSVFYYKLQLNNFKTGRRLVARSTSGKSDPDRETVCASIRVTPECSG